jgi:HlyD family secretion protein
VLVAVLLVVAGGDGYFAYTRYFAPVEEPGEPTLATATVTQGDIVLTADGSGELIPAAELGLAFRTTGTLQEVLVVASDQVRQGDVVAQLEVEDLERAVAETEVEVQIAQLELADIQEGASEAELADAEAAVRDARVQLTLAQNAYEATFDSRVDGVAAHEKVMRDWWVGYYQQQKGKFEDGHLSQVDLDWAMVAMIDAEGRLESALNDASTEEVQARNGVVQAQNNLDQAQAELELLNSEPLTDTVVWAMIAVDEALMAYEKAQSALAAVQLVAPFDGTVTEIEATVGEQVGTGTTILTLVDLSEPEVRFWVEESDFEKVVVGKPVEIVFEAYPDITFAGEVARVDPVLVMVDNTPAVQALAKLELATRAANLLIGMTADVEVIAAETRDALLVPVEALREMSPGQYSVFVLKADGQLEMRPVTVGLKDYVNAEVLSGLELGEVVSLGEQ